MKSGCFSSRARGVRRPQQQVQREQQSLRLQGALGELRRHRRTSAATSSASRWTAPRPVRASSAGRPTSKGKRDEDARALTPGDFDKAWSEIDGTGWENLKDCTNGTLEKRDPVYVFDIKDDQNKASFSVPDARGALPVQRHHRRRSTCWRRRAASSSATTSPPTPRRSTRRTSSVSGPLAGSTAVVTGASRGIGRAIALRLAEAGAEVALWARDSTALRMVASEIAAARGKARAIVVDVTDPDAVNRRPTSCARRCRRCAPS